jgi:hypothetical protein
MSYWLTFSDGGLSDAVLRSYSVARNFAPQVERSS